MSQESDEKIVSRAVDQLVEHFETVTVCVTRHDQAELDGTMTIVMGAGNWFARFGQMKAWLLRQEEKARHEGPEVP